MREFIYYSSKARTTGNFNSDELMQAGRMDIACQIVVMSFFVSHHMRQNVKLHLVFDGPPDAPKHLEMFPGENAKLTDSESRIDISKKDVAGLIKRMLYKYRQGQKTQVNPGYFVEKKPLGRVIEELKDEGKEIYILDRRGEDIREVKDFNNAVFIIGDQDGISKEQLKRLKKFELKKISVGNQMYFASQTMTIVQNELDRRNIE